MDNQIYICVSDHSLLMYDRAGFLTRIKFRGIVKFSHNGIYALTIDDGHDNTYYISIPKSIHEIWSDCRVFDRFPYIYYWVRNSDLLIQTKYEYYHRYKWNTQYHIYNIKNKNTCDIPIKSKIINAINYLIVQHDKVIIYDIHTMVPLKQISHPEKFIIFHKNLALLVTENFNYYKITATYELQKVNLGINYLNDLIYTTSQTITSIMDILNSCELCNLPNEIIYCELYKQILQMFDAE